MLTYVKCAFPDGAKLYTYRTDLELKKGDTVVVNSPSNGYQTVKVQSVHTPDDIKLISGVYYKWVVQLVDDTEYLARLNLSNQPKRL